MRVCFVSRGTLDGFWRDYGGSEADVLLFSFRAVDGEISYEKELKGETSYFEDVAILSKECKNIVVCPCVTDTRGIKRKSAVIAEKGRILGVSDMINCIDGEYNPGAGLKTYDTSVGKIGVAIGEDIYFPEVLRTLSVCGSDFIACPFGQVDGVESVLLRAASFCYGAPCLLCGAGYSLMTDSGGGLAFASPCSPVEYETELKKEYHLVETRRRGFYKSEKGDF